jgi:hypothetical protein
MKKEEELLRKKEIERLEEQIDIDLEEMRVKLMEENRTKISILWTMGAALVTVFVIITLAIAFFTIRNNNSEIQRLGLEIEYLSETVSIQSIYISDITKQISESPQSLDANINRIVEKLDSDYKKLQEIIIGNPANIIEFALLIKEIDTLKESYKEHKESVYNEMGRNFGLFQWFIYMNTFIALAIFGIAVTTYYQSRLIQKSHLERKKGIKT